MHGWSRHDIKAAPEAFLTVATWDDFASWNHQWPIRQRIGFRMGFLWESARHAAALFWGKP